MTLPDEFRTGRMKWEKLHNSASTDDCKAIIGALMLVVYAIDDLADSIDRRRADGQSDEFEAF